MNFLPSIITCQKNSPHFQLILSREMPFVIKDVLQHKLNDRKIREIHEREYRRYLTELRDQNPFYSHSKPFYLSAKHLQEIERSRARTAVAKQRQYKRIQEQNSLLYDRLVKANQRPLIDARNFAYEHNLEIFTSKRFQQRINQYKKIDRDNQLLAHRIETARGRLVSKEQCDREWNKHLVVMKKTCDYPENLDRFVSKTPKEEQTPACPFSRLRSAQVNRRNSLFHVTPLASLVEQD